MFRAPPRLSSGAYTALGASDLPLESGSWSVVGHGLAGKSTRP